MSNDARDELTNITFRVDGDMLRQLDEVADREERSRSWLVRQALKDFLRNLPASEDTGECKTRAVV